MIKSVIKVDIAPSDTRRELTAHSKRLKASTSKVHPLFGYHPMSPRVKLRKMFFRTFVYPEVGREG